MGEISVGQNIDGFIVVVYKYHYIWAPGFTFQAACGGQLLGPPQGQHCHTFLLGSLIKKIGFLFMVSFFQLISKMLMKKIDGLIFSFEVMTHKLWLHQAIFLIKQKSLNL